jgi:acyl-CoA hydrolase
MDWQATYKSRLVSVEEVLVSGIPPMLKLGAGITITRNHVHYVATENGSVDLYGQPIRQRVKLLISIANPAFRPELHYL